MAANSSPSSVEPPSGNVTLVFTDIENSSVMSRVLGDTYEKELRPEHERRIRAIAEGHRGYVVKTIGDSFMLAFANCDDAVACARRIQEGIAQPALAADQDGKTWTIKVRIGVHRAQESLVPKPSPQCPADYHGSDVNFAARVESIACGGQVVVSDSAYKHSKAKVSAQWKGWPNRRIKSFDEPETVWELLWDGRSRGEPGSRFVPDWFKGEQNRYIPRPELEREILAQFGKLLPDGSRPHLVTLHASGGMGKTRLAIACAVQAAGAFQDGVFLVKLDDKAGTAAAVAEAIGSALSLAPQQSLPQNLLTALAQKEQLLLLDNYESVDCEDVRRFVIDLLRNSSALRLLVTGREAVKISDVEQVFSLDKGMTEAEAEALFLARARLKKGPTWEPAPGERESIHRIVNLTDRIPLALELAAAWVNKLSLEEIAAGLEATPLGPVSAEPPRSAQVDQAPRLRSLTRSLDWSFNLLEPRAREGFARLGIFAGSFTADSVEGACGIGDANGLLFRLQDASLLRRFEADGRSRYTMLRPTRAYAAEKLGRLRDVKAIQRSFVQYFRETAQQKKPLTGPTADLAKKISALDWFEEEWENLLAAARCAFEAEDWKAVGEISETVIDFWQLRGHWPEVEELYNLALEASERAGDRSRRAVSLGNLGAVYQVQGRWAEAERAFQDCLAIEREVNDRVGEGQTLGNLGIVYRSQGRWAEAERAHQDSLAIAREFKDRIGEGKALNNLGSVYYSRGRWAEAEKAYQQSLVIRREFKDRVGEGQTLNNLGIVYRSQGRWEEAEKAYQDSLVIERELKDRIGEGQTLNNLGNVYGSQGRWAEAERAYQQSLVIRREFKDRVGEGQTLNNLALLKEAQKDIPSAVEYARQAAAVLEQTEAKQELQKARDILKRLEAG